MKNEVPTKSFATAVLWRSWLDANHATSGGIWLRIYKKGSGKKTVTYAEALDEALCYGWIDGQKGKGDDASWLQKFTPRRPKSIWSRRNREHATRLIETKRMQAAGQREVDSAKKKMDGGTMHMLLQAAWRYRRIFLANSKKIRRHSYSSRH